MESMLTRPVPEHSLSALAEGFGEEARKVRERKVEEAVIASDPSLDASALTPLSEEVDARLNASVALSSRTATALFEASLTTSHVALRSSGMYAAVGHQDPITAALTTPTAPSPTYYAVLRLLVAVTRTQLVPDEEGVPAGGGGAGYLAAPHPDRLGPAFPDIVRAEDPAYFAALQQSQKELAFAKSEYMEGLRKAYAAIGDDLSYCFDRKTLPTSPPGGGSKQHRGGAQLEEEEPCYHSVSHGVQVQWRWWWHWRWRWIQPLPLHLPHHHRQRQRQRQHQHPPSATSPPPWHCHWCPSGIPRPSQRGGAKQFPGRVQVPQWPQAPVLWQ